MSQKFISLDDASTRLGVSKDRLNQLREAGDLRAYRDGASWKFRTEEIEKLEADGVPSAEEASDDDYSMATGSDLGLAGLDDGPPTPEPTKSEDATPADDDDDDIDIGLDLEPLGDGDDAESILLTGDQELEGGLPRPQSTIIGKSELSLEDDLELASSSDVAPAAPSLKPAADSGSFDGIEELELDLESASSSKLDSESKADAPAAPAPADSGDFELEELELDLSGSDTNVEGKSGSDILGGSDLDDESPSLSGLGSVTGLSGIDSIDLAADEDDDMVLGGSDSSGDLAAGDSGINLSPSDSGFALDEVPLDLGGSAIGSQLDLASLSAAGSGASGPAISGLGGEDFQLTPADSGDEDEDSSQIVALDDISEEDEDVGGFEPDEEVDFEGGFDGGLGNEAAVVPVGTVAVQDIAFPGWVIGLLAAGFFSMLLCGLMALDLVQSMWAWDEPFAFNSSVIEGLLSIFGV